VEVVCRAPDLRLIGHGVIWIRHLTISQAPRKRTNHDARAQHAWRTQLDRGETLGMHKLLRIVESL
jgi:hypothetical protein